MCLSSGIGAVVQTNAQIHTLQGIASDIIDLTLQERAECGVHRETTRIAVGKIHTRSQHSNRQFTALFG